MVEGAEGEARVQAAANGGAEAGIDAGANGGERFGTGVLPSTAKARGRERFPSVHATRLGLLILVPGALLIGSVVVSWAQSQGRWGDGDTLTAEALNDIECSSLFYPNEQQCLAAISVGPILTERATGTVSVGHSYRYSCDTEDDGIAEPLEFGEAAIPEGEEAHERLIGGYAQYCCCGVDVSPVSNGNDGSGG